VPEFLASQTHWLEVVRLPGYLPEMNPVEALWAYLKNKDLANLVCRTIEELAADAIDFVHRHPLLASDAGLLDASRGFEFGRQRRLASPAYVQQRPERANDKLQHPQWPAAARSSHHDKPGKRRPPLIFLHPLLDQLEVAVFVEHP